MTTVSEYVVSRLAGAGIRHCFLLPGGGCMHLVDALARQTEIEPVVLLHEQSAAIATEAYAQATDAIGLLLVTTGPGGTNALTGVASAWLDSIPLFVISGQVKKEDLAPPRGVRQFGFQELPIVEMVQPITKMAVQVQDASDIPRLVDDLLNSAQSGRPGPVWLDIPLDLQSQEVAGFEVLASSESLDGSLHLG